MIKKLLLIVLMFTFITYCSGWSSVSIIPEKEDESCPVGQSISCNSIININNTVLRYERGNMTIESSTLPSKQCPWKIRGPPGTSILIQTTCYHHFHVRNLTEYAVCYDIRPIAHEFIISSKSCSGGYLEMSSLPTNEADFSVYYEKGHMYELGFTITISFIGDQLLDLGTSPETVPSTPIFKSESTTSKPMPENIDFMSVIMAVFNVIEKIVRGSIAR